MFAPQSRVEPVGATGLRLTLEFANASSLRGAAFARPRDAAYTPALVDTKGQVFGLRSVQEIAAASDDEDWEVLDVGQAKRLSFVFTADRLDLSAGLLLEVPMVVAVLDRSGNARVRSTKVSLTLSPRS